MGDQILAAEWYAILLLIISIALVFGTLLVIQRQPRQGTELSFSVPLVPWLPGISILINIYLMLQLDYMTWVRFSVWILIGFIIYFCYGIHKSKESPRYKTNLLAMEKKENLENINEDYNDNVGIYKSTQELID